MGGKHVPEKPRHLPLQQFPYWHVQPSALHNLPSRVTSHVFDGLRNDRPGTAVRALGTGCASAPRASVCLSMLVSTAPPLASPSELTGAAATNETTKRRTTRTANFLNSRWVVKSCLRVLRVSIFQRLGDPIIVCGGFCSTQSRLFLRDGRRYLFSLFQRISFSSFCYKTNC